MKKVVKVFLAATLFFVTAQSVLAYDCPTGTTKIDGTGVCVAENTGLSEVGVSQILTTLVSWLAFLSGSIAIILLIACGLMYLFSAGDDTQAENAKRCMKWSITGIIVVGLSWTIVRTVGWLVFGLPPLW